MRMIIEDYNEDDDNDFNENYYADNDNDKQR